MNMGVSERALRLRKSIQIYTEDIHNVLNCHNVAKHCKFDAHGTVLPNTSTAEHAHCVFWFEETKSATQIQRKFHT
jgi:hypothetical protein